MNKLITLLALAPLVTSAQTTFPVDVGGSLLDPNNPPYYAPQTLTINVGDIVQWNCTGGSHNIYAQLDIFPDNPDGFDNGPSANSPWTYSHTFTSAGIWDYHCTSEFMGQFHSTTQFGTITVLDPNGVLPIATNKAISLFPVPADDRLVLSIKGCTGVSHVDVLGADGHFLRSQSVTDNQQNNIDITGLSAGQYYLMMDRVHRTTILPFVKQ